MWGLRLLSTRDEVYELCFAVVNRKHPRVVGQVQNFAPVLELCRNGARIAKTKSELGAQRPALHSTGENIQKKCVENRLIDVESLAGRRAPSSDFVLAIRAAFLQSSRTGAKF